MDRSASRLRAFIPPFLVFLSVFALFAPSIAFPLVDFDDPDFIVRNGLVLGGFSWTGLKTAFCSLHGDTAMYSPLLWVSWMLDVSIFHASPDSPWPFHFGNVVLHALNGVFLFFILRRCRAAPLSAVLLALLWACHPLRVESVAWATERKDTLSSFFAFLSIVCYFKAFSPWGRGRPACDGGAGTSFPPAPVTRCRRQGFLCLALAAFGAGLLVKPMLVTIPFLFLLFDVFPLCRISLGSSFSRRIALRLFSEKIPFFLLSAAASVLSLVTQSTYAIRHDASLWERMLLVPLHYAFYLSKTILPVRLSPFYRPVVFSWSAFLPVVLLFVLLFVSVWRQRGIRPAWSLGILAFFGLFVPVIGFVHLGEIRLADRYTYLPSIGLAIAAIPLLSPASPLLRRIVASIAAVGLVVFSAVTLALLPTWSSSRAFYGRWARFFPDHPTATAWQVRCLIAGHGDFAAAERLLDSALEQCPDNDQFIVQKALCLENREGPCLAFDYLQSLPRPRLSIPGFYELAQYAARLGNLQTASRASDTALAMLPLSDALRDDFRFLVFAAAFFADDPAAMRRAAAGIPGLSGKTSFGLADLSPFYLRQWECLHRCDAWDYFRRLAAECWDSPPNLNNIAWFLATASGWNPAPPDEILAIAQRASDLAPDNPVILDTLAAAQANASDFPSALDTASRALGLAAADPVLSAKIRAHAALYARSLPLGRGD